VNASIGVPRSHFVRLFQERAGNPDAVPSAADLDVLVQTEVPKIRSHVQPLVDTGPKAGVVEGTVAVTMIPDLPVVGDAEDAGGAAAGAGGPAGGTGLLSDSLVKYTGLGGLAVLSIVMMLMMVRKAAVPPELPTEEELDGELPALETDLEIVGEATGVEIPMEGIEVTEADIRRDQMLSQIDEMATANPEHAAKIIRRWIREGES
jgi:hypothetical protein